MNDCLAAVLVVKVGTLSSTSGFLNRLSMHTVFENEPPIVLLLAEQDTSFVKLMIVGAHIYRKCMCVKI